MTSGVVPFSDVYQLGAAGLATAAVGACALGWGRRGQMVGDHPHCRACGYDLSGLAKGTGKCPECGGDLASASAITMGRRTPRPMWTWAGQGLLLIALVVGIQDYRLAVRAWEVEANRPVWWQRRQLTATAAAPNRDRAFVELRRRLDAKELWPSQMRAVARDLIELQGDPTVPWNRKWASFVAAARSKGGLGDADWQRFADHSVTITARCRSRVGQGDELPFECDLSMRVQRGMEFYYDYELVGVEVSGVLIDRDSVTRSEHGVTGPNRGLSGGYSFHTERFGPDECGLPAEAIARAGLKEGPQTLKLVFEVVVHAGPDYADTPASQAVVARKRVTRELPWTLLPPGVSSLEVMRSPELDAAVRAAPGTPDVWCVPGENGNATFHVDIPSKPAAVLTSMSVYARAGSREWLLGKTRDFFDLDGRIQGFNAGRIDLVFRPDVDTPLHTIDITRIWGGELVLPDVPVKWFTRDWSPTPPPTTAPLR